MEIFIKQKEKNNFIYLMDRFMRPLKIEIVDTDNTIEYIKKLMLEIKISNISFIKNLDLESKDYYLIDYFNGY